MAGALIGALAACDDAGRRGAARRESSARDPGTLIVGRPADAISLDPGRVTDNESAEIIEQIYEGLVRHKAGSSALEPALAERWDTTADGRVWTFHLRRGVRFHDGTPVDAAAVKFTFERLIDARHPFHGADPTGLGFAYATSLFRNVQAVEVLDPATVRITIKARYAPFEANLAVFPAAIVSPAAVAAAPAEFHRRPVGTGPFRLASWTSGLIVLERNPDYWGGAPALERLAFRTIPDGRQRLVALESGSIDVAYSILPDELQFVELHPDLALHRAAVSSVAYLAMNTRHPPFDDVRIRRAANLAINKEPIVKLAYQGLATPADGPLPPTQWGYHKSATAPGFDPAAGRALVAAARAEGRFDPTRVYRLYVPDTPRPYMPSPEEVGRVLQANLADIGILTEMVVQPFAQHQVSVQRGEHDLCLLGWVGDTSDPDNFLYVLLDADNAQLGSARNVAFLADEALHRLLVAAQTTGARSERERLYREAQDRVTALAPWVPLAHSQVAIAARADVSGIVINPSTHLEFRGVHRLGR